MVYQRENSLRNYRVMELKKISARGKEKGRKGESTLFVAGTAWPWKFQLRGSLAGNAFLRGSRQPLQYKMRLESTKSKLCSASGWVAASLSDHARIVCKLETFAFCFHSSSYSLYFLHPALFHTHTQTKVDVSVVEAITFFRWSLTVFCIARFALPIKVIKWRLHALGPSRLSCS